jgi:acyl carrier protein
VKKVIIRVLALDIAAEEIADEDPLYGPPISIDSLRLLQLVTELETEFAIQIDDEALMATRLVDVGSLVRLVEEDRTVAEVGGASPCPGQAGSA